MGVSERLMKKEYEVTKILNNNVILGQRKGKEVILIGKGIGFGKKIAKPYLIDEDKIEKIFCYLDGYQKEDYIQVINNLDYRIISISNEIIQMAREKIGEISPHIHAALTDHINFALSRLKDGTVIHNPFLYEIKALYQEEYAIGLKGKELIKKRLAKDIPDDEVGFIALHIHSAKENQHIIDTVKNTKLMSELLGIVEEAIGEKLDPYQLLYRRLINHLRQSISRVETDHQIVNPLLDEIKEKLEVAYGIATKVAHVIKNKKGIKMTEDEIGFMALHIERLRDCEEENV